MSSEALPAGDPHAHVRMSDSDRERIVERLNQAVSEGRLTLNEFEERIDGALAARTYGEVEPYVSDLPLDPRAQAQPDRATFSARGSSIVRNGRWTVPTRIRIEASGSKVRLDFTEAIIRGSLVRIALDVRGSGVRLTVPPGCSVEFGEMALHGSSARAIRLPSEPVIGGVHFVVTGQARGSSVRAMPPRTWRWPWQRRR